MPRKIILASTDLNDYGAIGAQFNQVVEDGDLKLVQTNVRRMIMPDQDPDEQCDDLDAYFTQIGYPTILEEDRQVLRRMREVAEANPNMQAAKEKWLEQQAAQQAAMQPPPEEPALPG